MDAAHDLFALSNESEHPPQTTTLPETTYLHTPPSLIAHEGTPFPPEPPSADESVDTQRQPEMPGESDLHASYMGDSAISFSDESPVDSHVPEYIRHMPPLESCFSGYATPHRNMDFDFNWGIDLSGLDFGFLDQHTAPEVFPEDFLSTDTQNTEQQSCFDAPQDEVTIRAEAFKRSVWRYMPPRDTNPGIAEEPNLALPDEEKDGQTQSHMVSRRATKDRLSYVARDKLLALVLSTSSPANAKQISAGFPSLQLLDCLIQIFLTAPSIDAASWLHIPTYSSSVLKPELLANIVAAGASCTSDKSLQKLGFALQEASRVGIGRAFDQDNSAIRDIQYLQIQLLQVETGMWSGISRKMEIAESFLQPPVTMLRRGGRFRHSIWKEIVPTPDDSGSALQGKWKEWVHQESWLRLVYRYFEFDRQSSMALLKPPLISYSEMQLPLPHPDSLWYANSAEAWRSAYFSSAVPMAKRPSPSDCLLDLKWLTYNNTANLVYLYMVWGMIWEYRQMATLMARLESDHGLILSSRYQEISKYFDDFRVNNSSSNIDLEIILQVMLMHLNAPLDDMQTFAGIAGPEEARHTYPTFRDWVKTPSARQALWHAGRILKLAQGLPMGTLRNFHAMAVYHAGLILWGYGLLDRSSTTNPPNHDLPCVALNGEESLDVRRFIKLNHGQPVLQSWDPQHPPVLIHTASQVIDFARHLLLRNHDATDGSYPPLVDSLVQLMDGLRSATK